MNALAVSSVFESRRAPRQSPTRFCGKSRIVRALATGCRGVECSFSANSVGAFCTFLWVVIRNRIPKLDC